MQYAQRLRTLAQDLRQERLAKEEIALEMERIANWLERDGVSVTQRLNGVMGPGKRGDALSK